MSFMCKNLRTLIANQTRNDMLPLFLKKNTKSFKQSFYMQRFDIQHTYDIWHNHVELEFQHILKGSGTRFIGDSIETFSSGDLVLVGSHLPHVWRSDKTYYESQELRTEVILTQFTKDFAGKDFFDLPEMLGVKELINDAVLGLQIIGATRQIISKRLVGLIELESGERLLEFIKILHYISLTKEYRKLSSVGFMASYQSKGSDRINKVYDFIMNNFTEDVTLQQVAEIANMNEAAFCRFFKSTTFKTFTQFLNEVRIGYACRLLLHADLNIASVGYESGFKNISYFNRVFRSSIGVSPQQYKKKHHHT